MPNFLCSVQDIEFVSSSKSVLIKACDVSVSVVGEKAFGLSSLPPLWTLPFVVVSSELIDLARTGQLELSDWLSQIYSSLQKKGISGEKRVIVRSSAVDEGMGERGKFYSVPGVLKDLSGLISEVATKTLDDAELNDEKVCLVIQEYISPSEKGHFSNEIRFFEEHRDWAGQIERPHRSESFKVHLRNWRSQVDVQLAEKKPLLGQQTFDIQKVMRTVASWGTSPDARLHFEWIWTGKEIYLVQVEEEKDDGEFSPDFINAFEAQDDFSPCVLQEITREHAEKFSKIHNVYVYHDLGLPTVPIYILDNREAIEELASGHVTAELSDDLEGLIKRSLVMRMDVYSNEQAEKQMLPRTHEVRRLEDATNWLIESAKASLLSLKGKDIAFIFHNFVPAQASAFAFAVPGERKVHIESLWGIPEGLYYNPHDKYVVDTLSSDESRIGDQIEKFNIRRKRLYKGFCVAPDTEGVWKYQSVVSRFGWKNSIARDSWIKKIAHDSRLIAAKEGKSISVMWFVGVPRALARTPVFPWFHEYYDPKSIPRPGSVRPKTDSERSFTIKTSADIDLVAKGIGEDDKPISQILVHPQEEKLLRDKDTLRKIGQLAKESDAVILLEGATLSHAYYQLIQTGASVAISHPFEDDEDKREFNKLVRDKIPQNIMSGGENVHVKEIRGEELRKALLTKLVEESYEALDAYDLDSLLDELADVSEVIDGVIKNLGVELSEIESRKTRKRNKAGGFCNGIVLLETTNPSISKKTLHDGNFELDFGDEPSAAQKVIPISGQVKKWGDRRKHLSSQETILKLDVPLSLDEWEAETTEISISGEDDNLLRGTIKGSRSGQKLKIELSVLVSPKQLDLL